MIGQWAFVAPSQPEWVETLEAVAHDIYHVPGYSECEEDVASGSATAFVFREGSTRLIVPLIIRPMPGTGWVDAASPYGYPGPASNAPLSDAAFWAAGSRSLLTGLRDMGAVSVLRSPEPLPPRTARGPRGGWPPRGSRADGRARSQPSA